ncbi:MAG TPA: hypothetical protein VF855_01240 [Acidimicrobiales bacterium]
MILAADFAPLTNALIALGVLGGMLVLVVVRRHRARRHLAEHELTL